MDKTVLLGKSEAELRSLAVSLGMPAFTGGQIARWIYGSHVSDIADMTNISKANRERLAATCAIGCAEPVEAQRSADGTVKYLFPVATTAQPRDKAGEGKPKYVETVYIPEANDRATLCVSCEVGCKMACRFCQTGRQGFHGLLTVADILNQIYSLPERDTLTNIVFMGQGEPMDNLDAVLGACEALTAKWGWAWSPKRITVSSVGVRGSLERFLDESECHVAISLHAPTHELRQSLMPAEGAMPIEEIVSLLRLYDFAHQRRLSFEYIVFGGVNDRPSDARALVRLLKGLHCRVNLIRFHQIPDSDLRPASEASMLALRDHLTANGIFTTIRASRGEDIQAACGLLSTAAATRHQHP